MLTLKTTAADDTFFDIFHNFRKKEGMIFHEYRLPADDSHEISILKKRQNLKLSSAANYRWCFMDLMTSEQTILMKYHMPYLLILKKWQNLKLSSAANYRWRFMG